MIKATHHLFVSFSIITNSPDSTHPQTVTVSLIHSTHHLPFHSSQFITGYFQILMQNY
ncbi:hypothetical protein HanRHA438_Chr14g0679691 [Helianthus annuus]|nr:hypothetical protein HanHA89_Chr14g0592541 [Helianthus annuus]KAJ0856021.1 hypothetical protein HanRHA438_Chr14g0679691 [Helianthus annuus]